MPSRVLGQRRRANACAKEARPGARANRATRTRTGPGGSRATQASREAAPFLSCSKRRPCCPAARGHARSALCCASGLRRSAGGGVRMAVRSWLHSRHLPCLVSNARGTAPARCLLLSRERQAAGRASSTRHAPAAARLTASQLPPLASYPASPLSARPPAAAPIETRCDFLFDQHIETPTST